MTRRSPARGITTATTAEISDAPYDCAVSVLQGQYGHTTEYFTVADKDVSALDEGHKQTTLVMVDKLCRDSDGGRAYPTSCRIDYDLTGNGPKAVEGKGLATVVTQGQNCSDVRDYPLATTHQTSIANTVGWSESTSVAGSVEYAFSAVAKVELTVTQQFGYSSSTTTTTTDVNLYSAKLPPRRAGEIVVTYDVLRLTTGLKATIARTSFSIPSITVTLRRPDKAGASVLRYTTFDPAQC